MVKCDFFDMIQGDSKQRRKVGKYIAEVLPSAWGEQIYDKKESSCRLIFVSLTASRRYYFWPFEDGDDSSTVQSSNHRVLVRIGPVLSRAGWRSTT